MNGIKRAITLLIFMLNISAPSLYRTYIHVEPAPKFSYTPMPVQIETIISEPESISWVDEEPLMSKEDIELIALVTMAEAEGESEEGKRLVIDTILNRMDSPYFPDTVYDVIYQRNAFSSMWNGRVDRCVVRDDIIILVEEELRTRLNYDTLFFTAGKYGRYGTPMFQVGNHYFSSYKPKED